jgi:hypothetical protein
MSCDLVEIRLNNGLVISFHDNVADGWFRKDRPSERDMWERMAAALHNTDFEAVKRLYGQVPPEPVQRAVQIKASPIRSAKAAEQTSALFVTPAAEKA